MSFPTEFTLEIAAEVPSTNAALLARSSPIHGLALLAIKQTAGRGRRGRRWDFQAGNMALSLALEPEEKEQGLISLLPFLAGIALFDTVHSFVPHVEGMSLKWPNDLMLGKKKLAGVLVEVRRAGPAVKVVIGVGLNLCSAPSLPDAISLLESTGLALNPEEVASAFLTRFTKLSSMLDDFPKLRDAWEERARHAGREIFYGDRDNPSTMRRAAVLGLMESGALLVRDEESAEEIELLSEDTSLRF